MPKYVFLNIRKFWSLIMPNKELSNCKAPTMQAMLAFNICKVWALTMPSMPSYAFIKIRKFWSLSMPSMPTTP